MESTCLQDAALKEPSTEERREMAAMVPGQLCCVSLAPEEFQSWRSSNASPDQQPRRHGDASGRRRKSAPEFRVAESEEGHSGTRRDSSSGRITDPEGEMSEQRETKRNAEPDPREETEERTEEPPREETKDATACHGPGGSWLDKIHAHHTQASEDPCSTGTYTAPRSGYRGHTTTREERHCLCSREKVLPSRCEEAPHWTLTDKHLRRETRRVLRIVMN
ncbi:hypothetical protein NDU88_005539 [Pleurodeles waltl]|uniref:Uncharacterized protein n=1 Tax=Pleurodeles waltl TaxID=8319 RepID=A0AAV7UIB7_PLEWA|nr:hypothetical protein NDU88_005539 [Pleurodeles waltl]